MSQQNQDFAKGVRLILEAVMFENWLRFYFITEKLPADAAPETEPELALAVPEQAMKKIEELYPHLVPLAVAVNGRSIDFETSRSAVCTFVVTEVDGKAIPRNMSDMVFDSSTFQVELQLFNTWVQAHEAQLDQSFLDFGAWRKLFAEWRTSDSVTELARKLQSATLHPEGPSTTVQ